MRSTVILSEAAGPEVQCSLAWSQSPHRESARSRAKRRYIPRSGNQLHTVFERHFEELCDVYDERLATSYSMFRLGRVGFDYESANPLMNASVRSMIARVSGLSPRTSKA